MADPPTGWSPEELTEFFDELSAKAEKAFNEVMDRGTPAELQPNLVDYMATYKRSVGADQVVLTNGDDVPVTNLAGAAAAGSPGGAEIAAGVLTRVRLTA